MEKIPLFFFFFFKCVLTRVRIYMWVLFLQLSPDLIFFLLKLTHVSSEMPRRYPFYSSSSASACHSSGGKKTSETKRHTERGYVHLSFLSFFQHIYVQKRSQTSLVLWLNWMHVFFSQQFTFDGSWWHFFASIQKSKIEKSGSAYLSVSKLSLTHLVAFRVHLLLESTCLVTHKEALLVS